MTGDNGLRDAVAGIIRREANATSYRPIRPETTAAAILALPAIREALAAVAQRDVALAIARPLREAPKQIDRTIAEAVCRALGDTSPTSPEEPT